MSQLPSTPPSQGNVQPLPDFTRFPHCSKWEDRDTMRGLGINSPHHVSSTFSIKDKAFERLRGSSRRVALIRGSLKMAQINFRFLSEGGGGVIMLVHNKANEKKSSRQNRSQGVFLTEFLVKKGLNAEYFCIRPCSCSYLR